MDKTSIWKADKSLELSRKPLSKLIVNSITKEFQLFTEKRYSKIFSINDLISCELKVDNEVVITSFSQMKKGVGKALAGNFLFGDAGMLAGAVSNNGKTATTSSQKEVYHYSFVLKVNDISKSSFIVNLHSMAIAEEVIAIFDILTMDQAKEEVNKIEEAEPEDKNKNTNATIDKFEKIKKYKELLDSGIITQEEFNTKKNRIIL